MKIIFKTSFLKGLKKIDQEHLKKEISDVIIQVETAHDLKQIKNIKKMKGSDDCYRIKVHDYRIGIISVSDTVYFVVCEHRRNIYRVFP